MIIIIPQNVDSLAIRRGGGPTSSSSSSTGKTISNRNQDWYDKRKNQGIKVSRRKTTKPPQWEKEGDSLYKEMIQENPYNNYYSYGDYSYPQGLTTETTTASPITITLGNHQQQQQHFQKMTYEDGQKLLIEKLDCRQRDNHHVSVSSSVLSTTTRTAATTTGDSEEIITDGQQRRRKEQQPQQQQQEGQQGEEEEEPPFLWGGLSVGPVWKQRLIHAGFIHPTPIQIAAFDRIATTTKRENLVLASSTGSGKSLAYLLPLLTTRTRKNTNDNGKGGQQQQQQQYGQVWIVTPTKELALQLQRVVATILDEDPEGVVGSCTVQVLNTKNKDTEMEGDDDDNDDTPILSSLIHSSSFFLAGTPRAYQQLMEEVKKPIIVDKLIRNVAKTVMKNLDTIVFDEADRLFETEALARQLQQQQRERQRDKERNHRLDHSDDDDDDDDDIRATSTFQSRKKQSGRPSSTRTMTLSVPLSLRLLKSIAFQPHRVFQHSYQKRMTTTGANDSKQHRQSPSSTPIRVLCASATVGRTLRRQLMETLETSSMDKAASLITADVRTKKDEHRRKASLLPSTLCHAYRLLQDDLDVISGMISTLLQDSQDNNDDNDVQRLLPAPTLVFPGRTGVKTVQEQLKAAGFLHVYGLDDLMKTSTTMMHNNKDDSMVYTNWKMTPIYVVNEKLVRGLDVPNLRYVISLQIPSSAAGYTHLTGRTGRNGQDGTAISFCHVKDIPKFLLIADTLGLMGCFENLG